MALHRMHVGFNSPGREASGHVVGGAGGVDVGTLA